MTKRPYSDPSTIYLPVSGRNKVGVHLRRLNAASLVTRFEFSGVSVIVEDFMPSEIVDRSFFETSKMLAVIGTCAARKSSKVEKRAKDGLRAIL